MWPLKYNHIKWLIRIITDYIKWMITLTSDHIKCLIMQLDYFSQQEEHEDWCDHSSSVDIWYGTIFDKLARFCKIKIYNKTSFVLFLQKFFKPCIFTFRLQKSLVIRDR